MSLLVSIGEGIGKLVHPAAEAAPLAFVRHRHFILSRLALALSAAALAPLCLALGKAPTLWQAASLAWLLLPLGAAAVLSRTGALVGAERLSLGSWLGLALTLGLSGAPITGEAVLLIVPLEAVLTSGPASAGPGILAAVVTAVVVAATSMLGLPFHAEPAVGGFGTVLLALGLVYAGWLVSLAGARERIRLKEERIGEERHRLLQEVVDEVLLRFDRSGAVLWASPAAEKLFGLRPRDLVGRGFFEQIHVAERPAFLKLVTDAAIDSEPRTARFRLRTGRTGESATAPAAPAFAWIELRARPGTSLEDTDATRPTAVIAAIRDVTARHLHEAVTEEARQAVERNLAARDLFLAKVSHELRTPLNAIIGFAEMLASDTLTPQDAAKRRSYATIIGQSGQHLLDVVNGILDASKIEAGSFVIAPESFDIGALVALCCDMVGLKAEQGRIHLQRNVTGNLPEIVADVKACKQILLNLLSNAIKFTPAGGRVAVTVRPEGTSMLLRVADTGIGIGVEHLPRLGDPFFQARDGYDRPYDGTGLGLSIVRGLVGLHGGRIDVESAPGQGTSVTVRLPLDTSRAAGDRGIAKIETISHYLGSREGTAGAAPARVQRSA